MLDQKYGTRVCLQCGQSFEAHQPAQVTCSIKCTNERRLWQKRMSAVKIRAQKKAYLLDLLASLDDVWTDLEWINCRYEARQRKFEALLMATCAAHALEMKKLKDQLAEAREALATAQKDAAKEQKHLGAEPEKCPPAAPVAPVPPQKTTAAKSIAPPNAMQECKRMHLRAMRLPCGEREECEGCEKIRPIVLEPGDKVCARCKKVFTPKNNAQKYCSKQCQEDAARAKMYDKK